MPLIALNLPPGGRALILALASALLISCAGAAQGKAVRLAEENFGRNWGDWPRVAETAGEAIELYPDFAWPYYQRGYAMSSMRRYDEAIRDFDEAVRLDPDYEEAYIEMAIIHVRLGQYDEALVDLNAALSLNKYNMVTLITLTELYSARGTPGAACDALRRAINAGFSDLFYLQSNPNFRPMLNHECFERFLSPEGAPEGTPSGQ